MPRSGFNLTIIKKTWAQTFFDKFLFFSFKYIQSAKKYKKLSTKSDAMQIFMYIKQQIKKTHMIIENITHITVFMLN